MAEMAAQEPRTQLLRPYRGSRSGTRSDRRALAASGGAQEPRDLGLEGTGISGAGLRHLHSLTELGWLELTGTNVGDAELVHLRGHTKLLFLHLDNTKITDAGLAHLARCTAFRVSSSTTRLSVMLVWNG